MDIYIILILALSTQHCVSELCDDGWQKYNQHCYFVSTYATTWYKARDLCRGQGAELTSILDQGEANFIADVIQLKMNYWIGLTNKGLWNETTKTWSMPWEWTDGRMYRTSVNRWPIDEPNGSGPCGRISNKRKWRDTECNLSVTGVGRNTLYICKKATGIKTTTQKKLASSTTTKTSTLRTTEVTFIAMLTKPPTVTPAEVPTVSLTNVPTVSPTKVPTVSPTNVPTVSLTNVPTVHVNPTNVPNVSPTNIPTVSPTDVQTGSPIDVQTGATPDVTPDEVHADETIASTLVVPLSVAVPVVVVLVVVVAIVILFVRRKKHKRERPNKNTKTTGTMAATNTNQDSTRAEVASPYHATYQTSGGDDFGYEHIKNKTSADKTTTNEYAVIPVGHGQDKQLYVNEAKFRNVPEETREAPTHNRTDNGNPDQTYETI